MHRVLFFVGDYPIYSFAVMVALSIFAGAFLALWQAPRVGIASEDALLAYLFMVGLSLVMGRLAFTLQHPAAFLAHPGAILRLRDGGVVWHGALGGAVLAVFISARRLGVSTAILLDACAAGLMALVAALRLGCLLNGCCAGRVCSLPWAIALPAAESGLVVGRHPTQVYEMIGALLSLPLLLYFSRRGHVPGQIFAGFVLLYSVLRFAVEFFRESTLLPGSLSQAQYVSLFLIGVSGWWIGARRGRIVLPPRATNDGPSPSSPATDHAR